MICWSLYRLSLVLTFGEKEDGAQQGQTGLLCAGLRPHDKPDDEPLQTHGKLSPLTSCDVA